MAPAPPEPEPSDALSAEDRARYRAMPPADLALAWDELHRRREAVGAILRERMVAAGVPGVVVDGPGGRARLRARGDGQIERRAIARPGPGGVAP